MEKRSKKHHTWKTRFWVKKRRRGKEQLFDTADKAYCKPFWDKHKAQEKHQLARLKKGVDESELIFPYNHRNSASWDYW